MGIEWATSNLGKGILAIIILALLALTLYVFAKEPIAEIKNWAFPSQTIVFTKDELHSYFSKVYNNYQNCKLSPDIDCYCDLNPELIPRDYTLEIENSNKQTIFRLWGGGVLYEALSSAKPAPEGDSAITQPLFIQNDETYIQTSLAEDVYSPSAYISQKQVSIAFQDDPFGKVMGTLLYSTTDLPGFDFVSFSNGKIYKKDRTKTIFIQESEIEGKRKCKNYGNIAEANTIFEELLKKIKLCSQFTIEDNKPKSCPGQSEIKLPQDYVIKINKNKLELGYTKESKKIRSEDAPTALCQLSSQLTKISDNLEITSTTTGIDIYKIQDNLVCLLLRQTADITGAKAKEALAALEKTRKLENPPAL